MFNFLTKLFKKNNYKKLSDIRTLNIEKAKKQVEKELAKKEILKQKTYNYYLKNLYKIISKKIENGDYIFSIGKWSLPYYDDSMIPQLEGCYNAMCDLAATNLEIFDGLYMRKDWLIEEEDKLPLVSQDYRIKFIYKPAFDNTLAEALIVSENETCNEKFISVYDCKKI